jgi:pyruvate kinase
MDRLNKEAPSSERPAAECVIVTEVAGLYREIDALVAALRREGDAQMAAWADCVVRAGFAESASNLASYMALRRRDLRPLQRPLMALGLSSLGRLESRVLPTLVAVRAALAALAGLAPEEGPPEETFFAGERRLVERAHELLGMPSSSRPTASSSPVRPRRPTILRSCGACGTQCRGRAYQLRA